MKKMIKAVLVCLPILMLPACAVTRITDGTFTAYRATFGNKTAIGHLQATHGTNSLVLDQYANDQVEALTAVTAAAVSAAVKSAVPVP